jgi:hypothetical protein
MEMYLFIFFWIERFIMMIEILSFIYIFVTISIRTLDKGFVELLILKFI